MTAGSRLVTCAVFVLAAAVALRSTPLAQAPAAPAAPVHRTAPVAPNAPAAPVAPGYLGSKACQACHESQFAAWQRSLHIRMTKPIDEATVVGDFRDGTRTTQYGRSYEFGMKDGRPFIRIAFGERAPETFNVDYTLGFKRYQGYLSKQKDGTIYVLPVFWHIESRRWLDWKELAPVPDQSHNLRQIWNINCFNCHATNLVQGFDVKTKHYNTTWTEMGIGCEACHGPGGEHAALMEAWQRDPASRPAYDRSAKNRELGSILKIFSARTAGPRPVYDTCSYCHANKTNVFTGFRGGASYSDFAIPFLISTPIPANDFQGEFWPDGRPNRFNRPQALTLSGCFKAGAIACTNCHVAHGSRFPHSLKVDITEGRNADTLCTQCHSTVKTNEMAAALEKHTFHSADSAGSRCINCHMSDVNWRMLIRRRDHTYQPPVPEMTVSFGVPNACTTCHDNRSPEWAARQMDQWWGDSARRKAIVALADTMYRAGSGDQTAIPALVRYAVDRSQGMLVRASAVEFIDQLARGTTGTAAPQSQTSFGVAAPAATLAPATEPVALLPEQINALIGAAADPEPTVRALAVKALAATGQRDRIITPIVARLVDSSRVVRAYAAEALLGLGIARLPGQAGEALTRAQDDYIASLQAFPDAPANHAELAWLEAERGRAAEAYAAADTALHLEPRYARPWVIKGVVSAREGKYGEAVEAWKKARGLEPSYPNIDRLIAEAEKLQRQ